MLFDEVYNDFVIRFLLMYFIDDIYLKTLQFIPKNGFSIKLSTANLQLPLYALISKEQGVNFTGSCFKFRGSGSCLKIRGPRQTTGKQGFKADIQITRITHLTPVLHFNTLWKQKNVRFSSIFQGCIEI